MSTNNIIRRETILVSSLPLSSKKKRRSLPQILSCASAGHYFVYLPFAVPLDESTITDIRMQTYIGKNNVPQFPPLVLLTISIYEIYYMV